MAPSYIHIQNRVIITKVTSALSMASSFFIMRDVYRRRKRGEIPLTSSLVFLMSCCDFFFSFFVTFLNSWMVPKETGAYLAAGNQKTCAAQGFMYVFFLTSTILTNASLAVTYCLKVRWRRVNIYSHQKVLWALHLLPPFVGFCLAVAALLDGAYNFSGGGLCEIAPYPYGCRSSDSDFECTRGLNYETLRKVRFAIAVTANAIIIVAIVLLIWTVLEHERKMDTYNVQGNAPRREWTVKTTWQGIFYISAFELAYGPWYLWQIIFVLTNGTIVDLNVSVALGYVLAFLFPSQGFWNALVYFRPRYKSLRVRHKSDSRLTTVTRLLSITVPSLRLSLPQERGEHGSENDLHVENNEYHFPNKLPESDNSNSHGMIAQGEVENSHNSTDDPNSSSHHRRSSILEKIAKFNLFVPSPSDIPGDSHPFDFPSENNGNAMYRQNVRPASEDNISRTNSKGNNSANRGSQSTTSWPADGSVVGV